MGYLFFKHIRKAAGTTLRAFFYNALEYHNQSRSFDLSPHAQAMYEDVEEKWNEDRGGSYKKHYYDVHKQKTAKIQKAQGERKSGYNVHYIEQEFDAVSVYHLDSRSTITNIDCLIIKTLVYTDGLAMS